MSEHAVHIRIPLSDRVGVEQQREQVLSLEDELRVAVTASGSGVVDGHGFGFGVAELFLYGPDADDLFSTVEPVLRQFEVARAAEVTLRYGDVSDPDARTVTFNLAKPAG